MSVAARIAIANPCGSSASKRRSFHEPSLWAMHILIASSSAFRRDLYQRAIHGLGHNVFLADGGIDCVRQMRAQHPDVLLLEAPLLWGGCDGVLDILQNLTPSEPRVILVAAGTGSIDWFRLSRFRVDDVLFRLPTVQELQQAIGNAAPRPTRGPRQPDQQLA
jgi:CheY-like chemotaxis protein